MAGPPAAASPPPPPPPVHVVPVGGWAGGAGEAGGPGLGPLLRVLRVACHLRRDHQVAPQALQQLGRWRVRLGSARGRCRGHVEGGRSWGRRWPQQALAPAGPGTLWRPGRGPWAAPFPGRLRLGSPGGWGSRPGRQEGLQGGGPEQAPPEVWVPRTAPGWGQGAAPAGPRLAHLPSAAATCAQLAAPQQHCSSWTQGGRRPDAGRRRAEQRPGPRSRLCSPLSRVQSWGLWGSRRGVRAQPE